MSRWDENHMQFNAILTTRYTVRGRGAKHSSRPWETLMRPRFYDFSLERQIVVTPRILF